MKKYLDELQGMQFDIFGFNQNEYSYILFKKPAGTDLWMKIEGMICLSIAPRGHSIVKYATVEDEYFIMRHQYHMAKEEFMGQKFIQVYICFDEATKDNGFLFSDIVFLCTSIDIQEQI